MLVSCALMIMFCKAKPKKAISVPVWQNGIVAVVAINSQGAVVVSMLPLAYALGIPGWILLVVMPSTYGYFFIPNYPSDIATVNFDRSRTIVIGKYLLNHSFMAPGMIHVIMATIAGLGISYVYHFWFGLY